MAMFDPKLTPVAASNFIAPSVTDTSTSTLMSGLGKIAGDAYTGYQMADLQKDITKEAETFFGSQQHAQDFTVLKMGEEELLMQPGGAPDVNIQNQYIGDMEKKLSKYSNAARQGRMSTSELQSRILDLTRQAVNANPMIQRELLQTADKYMELSGLGSYIKADQQMIQEQAKTQADMIKDQFALAKSLDVYINPFADPLSEVSRIQPMIAKAQLQKEASAQLDFASKSNTVIGKAQAQEWIKHKGSSAYMGDLNNFKNEAIQILSIAKTPQEVQSALQQVKMIAGNLYQSRYAIGLTNGIASEESFKGWIDTYKSSFDTVLKDLDQFTSGADAVKYLDNQIKLVQGQQELALSKQYNLAAINLGTKIGSAFPQVFASMQVQQPELAAQMANIATSLVTGTQTPAVVEAVKPTGGFDKIAAVASVSTDPEVRAALPTILQTGITALNQSKDPVQATQTYDNTIRALLEQGKLDLDPAGKDALRGFIGEYVKGPMGVDSMVTSMRDMNGQVQLDVSPDGGFVFSGEKGAEFRAKYGVRMNNALSAYALTHQIGIKEALPRFMEEYGITQKLNQKTWDVKDPDLATLNAMVKSGDLTPQERDTIAIDAGLIKGAVPSDQPQSSVAPSNTPGGAVLQPSTQPQGALDRAVPTPNLIKGSTSYSSPEQLLEGSRKRNELMAQERAKLEQAKPAPRPVSPTPSKGKVVQSQVPLGLKDLEEKGVAKIEPGTKLTKPEETLAERKARGGNTSYERKKDGSSSGVITKSDKPIFEKAKPESKPQAKEPAKPVVHTVVKGDTLSAIAKSNRTTIKKLLELNPWIKDKDNLQLGKKVKVK